MSLSLQEASDTFQTWQVIMCFCSGLVTPETNLISRRSCYSAESPDWSASVSDRAHSCYQQACRFSPASVHLTITFLISSSSFNLILHPLFVLSVQKSSSQIYGSYLHLRQEERCLFRFGATEQIKTDSDVLNILLKEQNQYISSWARLRGLIGSCWGERELHGDGLVLWPSAEQLID